MSLVSLSLVKKHVRADDFAGDDDYLQHLTNAAEDFIVKATNRTIDDLKTLSADGVSMPLQLQQSVLLLVGHWYNQREAVAAVSMLEAPYTIQALIKPFRKLV